MENHSASSTVAAPSSKPGDTIRALRKKSGMTLSDVSGKTGLAVSTLSKLEKGHVSLSYDKLMLLSKGLGVDMAQLLDSAPQASEGPPSVGRRVVQREGEGRLVETHSYKQLYLATELLHKRFTPLVVEVRARTMQEFLAEFGDFIRHPGEEFAYVLQGEVDFHTELYAPLRVKAGDSFYFDSEMGHAYLKASDEPCRIVAVCSPRSADDNMIGTFVSASEKRASKLAETNATKAAPRKKGHTPSR